MRTHKREVQSVFFVDVVRPIARTVRLANALVHSEHGREVLINVCVKKDISILHWLKQPRPLQMILIVSLNSSLSVTICFNLSMIKTSANSSQIAKILKISRVQMVLQVLLVKNFSLASVLELMEMIRQTTAMRTVNKNHWKLISQMKDKFFFKPEINLKYLTPKHSVKAFS